MQAWSIAWETKLAPSQSSGFIEVENSIWLRIGNSGKLEDMKSTLDPRAEAVLQYWFGELNFTETYFDRRNRFWFGGGETVDAHIRAHYETDVIAAADGKLESWKQTPKGTLALIILLDQFSLNLYREQPRSYRQSELAIPLARHLIDRGWEWTLTPMERVFAYLPFEHSENLEDQEYAVELYQKLADGAPETLRAVMDGYLDYAERHHRVVKKYGRFPDRNEVFGRENTPEEESFLASDEAPF